MQHFQPDFTDEWIMTLVREIHQNIKNDENPASVLAGTHIVTLNLQAKPDLLEKLRKDQKDLLNEFAGLAVLIDPKTSAIHQKIEDDLQELCRIFHS